MVPEDAPGATAAKAPVPQADKDMYARQLALTLFSIGGASALFAVMGCFGDAHQALELTTHFYLQYALALTVASGGLLAIRRWKPAVGLLPFLVLCAVKIVPLYMPIRTAATGDAPHLRIGTINVRTVNTRYDLVLAEIARQNPDVVAMEEIDQNWLNQLRRGLSPTYPYFVDFPQPDDFGICIFSKAPLFNKMVKTFGGANMPCVMATLNLGGKPVTLLAMHALPPMNTQWLNLRTAEMQGIVDNKQLLGEHFVVLGDMNCSSWSPYFQRFVTGLNAYDSRRGFGLECSWPSDMIIFRTTIDHILPSKQFVTVNHHVGAFDNSDHFPVFADLVLLR
jgi:endonuclease/exonuclease/phosphatase (EEP) superfamily protein YafD